MNDRLNDLVAFLNTVSSSTPFATNGELVKLLGVTGKRKLRLPKFKLPYAYHKQQLQLLEGAISFVLSCEIESLSDLDPIAVIKRLSPTTIGDENYPAFRASRLVKFQILKGLEDATSVTGFIDFTAWVQAENPIPDADWRENETLVRKVTALWFVQAHCALTNLVNKYKV